jgi:hypothetical protein
MARWKGVWEIRSGKRRGCHQRTRGILSAVCTSPLLDILGLKYVSETFIEA